MPEATRSPLDKHVDPNSHLFLARLAFHIANEATSFEDYVAKQRNDLTESLKAKHIVYLDTNAWKCLSDCVRGKQTLTPQMKAFCEAMENDVVRERCAFPLGLGTLFELQSMDDPVTQETLTELVDKYAENICLHTQFEVVPEELDHFMRNPSPLAHPYGQRFCRSTELVLAPGRNPLARLVPDGAQPAFKKATYDVLTSLPLSSQLEMARESMQPPWDNAAGIEEMNVGTKAHQSSIKSFIDALCVELAAVLSFSVPSEPKIGGRPQQKHWALEALLHWREHPQSQQLVTARIQATLHAVLRFSHNRSFRRGDIIDFATAATAIPACHAFFTDRRLVMIAQDSHSNIAEFSNCALVHGFDGFADYLSAQASQMLTEHDGDADNV